MVGEARASNNIGLLPDHSGGGEVILSFTSPALQNIQLHAGFLCGGKEVTPLL